MSFFVSIIIPFRKKNPYLEECLHHIEQLTYKDFEVILLPDQSETYPSYSFPLKVIPTGPFGPAQKRDIGNKAAQGTILAFIDDDAYPDPDWLTPAITHFQKIEVAAITGPAATPSSDSFLQKASGLVYSNRFSSGHCTHRYCPQKQMEIDDAASVNLLVRKSDYEKVGGFNTHYYPGEDTKLCLDFIQQLKKKIIYDPKSLVWHHRRSLFLPHLKQVSQYALHRGYFIKRFPKNSLKLNYFLPTFFTLYMILLLLTWVYKPQIAFIFSFPFILYIFLFIRAIIKENSFSLSAITFMGGFLTHLTYGIYFIKGFLSTELKR
ncbi:MAG: hypothetical protein A2Z91_03860 [Deltaproteobacteria bacterium GWA2_38_16]|nr:MAG: hypothetical protein A2Z91_03860 [Deltaproteobacteria bacterium GWA2_38_16]OGQ01843.1 MAG: hypothetical protein A3D19_02980 [Deltaproteobacteria bacterium RIFCSPHIGHO2_02_FULL_38_15]OGQ34102.1 MAG: hypothetical protein A3A72_06730 [Deltaproteobacteria bacterium RIFCSPLOWO2_01_FULL_38_9]OGQ60767.1 MAG: hypothetical protein A3G92_04950 [Deltaproteobacteria bacterium RIFCSPLOWO2_12_FULL_38_8]HBQ20802.1 glycosyl transferase [Deltaproteobacteria bacterium]